MTTTTTTAPVTLSIWKYFHVRCEYSTCLIANACRTHIILHSISFSFSFCPSSLLEFEFMQIDFWTGVSRVHAGTKWMSFDEIHKIISSGNVGCQTRVCVCVPVSGINYGVCLPAVCVCVCGFGVIHYRTAEIDQVLLKCIYILILIESKLLPSIQFANATSHLINTKWTKSLHNICIAPHTPTLKTVVILP